MSIAQGDRTCGSDALTSCGNRDQVTQLGVDCLGVAQVEADRALGGEESLIVHLGFM